MTNFEFFDDLSEKEYREDILKRMEEVANGKRKIIPKIDTNNEYSSPKPKRIQEQTKIESPEETIQETSSNKEELPLNQNDEKIPENKFGIPYLTDQQVYGIMDDYEQEMYGVMEQQQVDGDVNTDYEDSVNSFDFFSDSPW